MGSLHLALMTPAAEGSWVWEGGAGSSSASWRLASAPCSALPRLIHILSLTSQVKTGGSGLSLRALDHTFLTRVLSPPRGENWLLVQQRWKPFPLMHKHAC